MLSANRIVKFVRAVQNQLPRARSRHRNILVDARTPMNYAVIRPVCDSMRDDRQVRFYFTASEQPSRANEIYRESTEDIRIITPNRAALGRFDAYIAADLLWARLLRGSRRIQMFHGVAGKYGNVYDAPRFSMREWHRIFFINGRRMRNFVEAGAIDPSSPNARLIGYPKLDCLVDGSLKRDEILRSMRLDPGKFAVLYAPTWSPYSSLNAMGEELVTMLGKLGCSVIVKLHDRSRYPEQCHSGGVDWPKRLAPILDRIGGVLADGSNVCPYLAAADLLITDHSSVGFEYLLLDRPVIRIEVPELIKQTGVPPEYVSLLAEASSSVRTAGAAVEAAARAFSEPSLKSCSRRSVAAELFYKPGSATMRAVKELYDVIELDAPPHCRPTEEVPKVPS